MFSILKKNIIIKKFYQTELYQKVRKHKRTNIRLYYLKSKNGEHRKNFNLSKLYLNVSRKWYFGKKNNIKLNTSWYYTDSNYTVQTKTPLNINCVIDESDIKWFY